jgi:hypothetical protein
MNIRSAVNRLIEELCKPGSPYLIFYDTTIAQLMKPGEIWLSVEFISLSGDLEVISIEASDTARVVEFFNQLEILIHPQDWQTIVTSRRIEEFGANSLWLSGLPDDPTTPTLAETFGLT